MFLTKMSNFIFHSELQVYVRQLEAVMSLLVFLLLRDQRVAFGQILNLVVLQYLHYVIDDLHPASKRPDQVSWILVPMDADHWLCALRVASLSVSSARLEGSEVCRKDTVPERVPEDKK